MGEAVRILHRTVPTSEVRVGDVVVTEDGRSFTIRDVYRNREGLVFAGDVLRVEVPEGGTVKLRG